MSVIDLRVVILSYTASSAICTALAALLWLQNRRHFAGLGFWPTAFAMQWIAIVLIALRGIVPDFVSIVVGNAVLILGIIFLYIGLQHFVEKRGSQIHNAILLVIFVLIHTYFAIIQPDFAARNINVSLVLLVLCAQAAWLMLRRTGAEIRSSTRSVGIVFVALCVISAVRIIVNTAAPPENAFFRPDHFDTLLLLIYHVAYLALTFSLSLMVNHRLFADLEYDSARRQQAEDGLRKSEERFRSLVETSSDWIWEVDRNGLYTYASPKVTELLGYSPEEIIGKTPFDLIVPEESDRLATEIQRLMKQPEPLIAIENTNLHKDGRLVVLETSGVPILDSTGSLIGYRGIDRDITERKRAENVLRVQRKLAVLLGSTASLIEGLEHILEMTCQIEGIDCGSVYLVDRQTGAHNLVVHRGLSAEFVERASHFDADAVQIRMVMAGSPIYVPIHSVPPDESEFHQKEGLRALAVLPVLHEGKVVAVLNLASHTHDNIDENTRRVVEAIAAQVGNVIIRMRTEETLLESQRNLQSLFDTIDDFIFLLDGDANILRVNPVVRERLGYSDEELIGAPVLKLHPPDRREEAASFIADMLAGKASFYAVPVMTKDGNLIPVETRAVRGKWDNRDVLIGLSRDVTEHQRSEELIRLRLRLWEYAASHPVDKLMQKALDEIEDLTGSLIGFYHFVEEDQITLSLQAWSTRTRQEFCLADGKGLHYNIDKAGVWVDCVHQRKPVIHNNYAALSHRKGMPDGHAEVVRELVVPTMRNERVMSILGVGNKPSDYDEKDIELVAYVADVVWEIVERKQAEQALQQSEERFRTVVGQAGDGFELLDATGKFMDVNEATCRMLGYSREEMLLLSILDVDPVYDPEDYTTRFQSLIGKPSATVETRHRRKDGTEFPVEVTSSIIRVGTEHFMISMARDITERKQAEEVLRRRATQLSILNDVGKQIAAVLELDSVLDRATHLIQENFGYHHVAIFTIEREQAKAVMKTRAGSFVNLFPPNHSLELGQGMVGWAAQQGQRLLANDVRNEPHYVNYYPDVLSTRSELAVPIRAGQEIVGVLDIQSPQLDGFVESDVTVLETLAGQIAAAMENARLYESIQRELTERKQAEEAMRQSEEHLKRSQEIAHLGSWELELSSNRLTWSDEVYRIFGLKPQELAVTYEAFLEGVHPDDRTAVDHAYSDSLKKGHDTYEIEHRIVRKTDGEIRYVHEKCEHLRDTAGTVVRSIGMIHDITERKRAEEALRRQNEYLNALQKTTLDLISWLDLSTLLEKIVRRAGLLMGTSSSYLGLVEPETNELKPEIGLGALAETLTFRVKPGEGVTGTVWQTAKPLVVDDYDAWTGRVSHFSYGTVRSAIGVPLMSGSQVLGVLALAYDPKTTWVFGQEAVEFLSQFAHLAAIAIENARLIEALRKSNAELQSRSEELDAFGHTVAHDLKNPLSNIIGFAYLMEDRDNQPTEQEMQQMILTIKHLGLKMDSIIEELMLLSGLRRAEVEMRPLNMDTIMTETLWRLAHLIDQSQAEIVCPTSWPTAMGHASWVEEVWINYISNAVKYGGHPPHIELGVTQEGENLRFWIQDNGPGLSPEEQARLFSPFERLDQAHISGHGLGLSIVRRIVERMGGQVGVKSSGVAGEGCIFSFILPAA